MRATLIIALLFAFFGALAQENDCYFHHLKKEITPLGRVLDYRKINDSTYNIFWGGEELNLRKLQYDFYCSTPPVARPTLEAESDSFIFLRSGCGSACQIAHILPLNSSQEPIVIPNYFKVDLENELVISLDSFFDNELEVFDLKEFTMAKHKINIGCNYAMPFDCIDSIITKSDSIVVVWESLLNTPPLKLKIRN
uniref:hypothetical protein n=1 Tax=Roseivirga sp. TaxID=1964215 RepID=UPI0040487753